MPIHTHTLTHSLSLSILLCVCVSVLFCNCIPYNFFDIREYIFHSLSLSLSLCHWDLPLPTLTINLLHYISMFFLCCLHVSNEDIIHDKRSIGKWVLFLEKIMLGWSKRASAIVMNSELDILYRISLKDLLTKESRRKDPGRTRVDNDERRDTLRLCWIPAIARADKVY